MAVKTARKNSAAVALGRKGGKKGGPARAAKLTPEQRSESARKAVQARWAKARQSNVSGDTDTSDSALLALLKQLKTATDPAEVRGLSDRIERVIFHKQFESGPTR
jgi:hypothetical protein